MGPRGGQVRSVRGGLGEALGAVETRILFRDGFRRILFVAVGTGLDIQFFPPGRDIVGVDISERMLEKARPRVEAYPGSSS